ncbi:hypothetical protein EDB19DRAFT_1635271, partial [Suillus lakei]
YLELVCFRNVTWIYASGIDERSVRFAEQNVSPNSMDGCMVIERVQADGPILQPLHTSSTDFDFIICNPPFYSSAEDVLCSSEFKELGPRKTAFTHMREFNQLVCSGAEVEMVTQGGAF